jgi:BlaI family penicillinase repressor
MYSDYICNNKGVSVERLPRISEAEWLVMQVFWSEPGLTADEVVQALQGRTRWSARTIRTLINRLLRKKALEYEKEGRRYRYFPAVSRKRCIREERRSFVERVYGGTVTPMLAAFIEEAKLSREDIEELKRILDEKERQ